MSHWWYAIDGAIKWRFGKRAHPRVAVDRAKVCSTCPKMQVHRLDSLKGVMGLVKFLSRGPIAGFCGTPGEEGEGTCGCIVTSEPAKGDGVVTLTVGGEAVTLGPAGKTLVQAERCPSGKW